MGESQWPMKFAARVENLAGELCVGLGVDVGLEEDSVAFAGENGDA